MIDNMNQVEMEMIREDQGVPALTHVLAQLPAVMMGRFLQRV